MTVTKAFEWPSPEVLVQNAMNLRARYQAEVDAYEYACDFTTEVMAGKLPAGEIEETDEACRR